MTSSHPATISPKESVNAPASATAQPQAAEPKMPLNPTAADLPKEAVPAMESVETMDAPKEEDAEPAAPEAPAEPEAGASDLANAVAPEPTKKEVEGTDEILEQLRSDKHARIDDAAEDSDVDLETNQILLGARGDELVADLLKHYQSSPEKYKAAKRDPKSLLSRAIAAADHGWGTTSGSDIEEVLKNSEAWKKLHEQSDVNKFPGIKDGRPNRVNHKNTDLAGKEAILAIKARLGGLVRVNLLNSGFWVAIRSPQLDELQEIFASIDFENKQIGRILGGHFALITDMYLKRKFVEIMISKRLIIESNFKDIFKAGAFVRNLAYHDYDTLLHAIVMLMTRGGLRYRCVCPKCGAVSIETLDVGACKFVNEDLWTPEVANWWAYTHDAEGKPVRHDEKDLIRYRTEILNAHSEYIQEVENGLKGEKIKISLSLSEPTFQKFFEIGDKLIRNLNETIDHISNGDEDKADMVRASLSVHSYQLIAPWIDNLQLFNADGQLDIKTSDPEAILAHLDETVQKDEKLFKTLTEFITKSRFNYIGTHQIKCAQCGLRPTSTMENFYPLEIQTIFFGLLSRLWLAGR